MTLTPARLVLATILLALAPTPLVGATAPAVAAPSDPPPPRTSATVTDPAYDSTGTDPDRRSRSDVLRVDYAMPLPRNSRTLTIETTLRRVGADGLWGQEAPPQQVKTFIDGPGGRDYAVTVYNSERVPRVVALAGDRPRRVGYSNVSWRIASGREGTLEVALAANWLRGMDRADFTATGLSRQATDRSRTAVRLNTRYAGIIGPSGTTEERGEPGPAADPVCTETAGALSCSVGAP